MILCYFVLKSSSGKQKPGGVSVALASLACISQFYWLFRRLVVRRPCAFGLDEMAHS